MTDTQPPAPMSNIHVQMPKEDLRWTHYQSSKMPEQVLSCSNCGTADGTVKTRPFGTGLQCYKCYADEKYFEDEYQ